MPSDDDLRRYARRQFLLQYAREKLRSQEDAPRRRISRPGDITSKFEGTQAIPTERITEFTGPLPGDLGAEPISYGKFASAALGRAVVTPVAGVVETLGKALPDVSLLKAFDVAAPEGTTERRKKEFEEIQQRYLDTRPNAMGFTTALLTRLVAEGAPILPGAAAARFSRAGVRLAQGMGLSDDAARAVAGALPAAFEGGLVGLGESADAGPATQVMMATFGVVAGGAAGGILRRIGGEPVEDILHPEKAKVRRFLAKQFRSSGILPTDIHQIGREADGILRAEMMVAENNALRFDQTLDKVLADLDPKIEPMAVKDLAIRQLSRGGGPEAADFSVLRQYGASKEAVDELAEGAHRFRRHINEMSTKIQESGRAGPEGSALYARLELGKAAGETDEAYMRRTFDAMLEDPLRVGLWSEKALTATYWVPDPTGDLTRGQKRSVWADSFKLLKKEMSARNPDVSDREVENVMFKIAEQSARREDIQAVLGKREGPFPEPIDALLGLRRDPSTVYWETISGQAQILAEWHWGQALRELGEGRVWWKNVADVPGVVSREVIAAPEWLDETAAKAWQLGEISSAEAVEQTLKAGKLRSIEPSKVAELDALRAAAESGAEVEMVRVPVSGLKHVKELTGLQSPEFSKVEPALVTRETHVDISTRRGKRVQFAGENEHVILRGFDAKKGRVLIQDVTPEQRTPGFDEYDELVKELAAVEQEISRLNLDIETGSFAKGDLSSLKQQRAAMVRVRESLKASIKQGQIGNLSTGKKGASVQGKGALQWVPIEDITAMNGKPFEFPDAFKGNKVVLQEKTSTVYTLREVHEALTGSQDVIKNSALQFMNAFAKQMKTVYSIQTQARNFLANPLFLIASGHLPFRRPAKSGTGKFKSLWDLRVSGKPLTDEAEIKTMYELTRRNVLLEGVNQGDMKFYRKVMEDFLADPKAPTLKKALNLIKSQNGLSKLGRAMRGAYQVGDEYWKMVMAQKEFASQLKIAKRELELGRMQSPFIKDGKINEEFLWDRTAEIVRDHMPSYSMIPKAIRTMRSNVLIGTFVSFPAEVVRNTKNVLMRGLREVTQGANSAEKKMGAQRLAGLFAALSLPEFIASAMRERVGAEEGDERMVQAHARPWETGSTKVFWSIDKKKGEFTYFDMSFLDPFAYLKKPVLAAIARRDPSQSAVEAIFDEFQDVFLAPELFTTAVGEIAFNRKGVPITGISPGGEVASPLESAGEKAAQRWKRVYRSISPGTFNTLERIGRAAANDNLLGLENLLSSTTDYGQTFELGPELLAVVGPRAVTIDVRESLGWKLQGYLAAKRNARNIWLRENRNHNTTPDRLRQARGRANDAIKKSLLDITEVIDASRNVLTDAEIMQILQGTRGITEQDIRMLFWGQYEPIVTELRKQG